MTVEADLATVLRTVCPNVFPGLAPLNTPRPYITYENVGGVPFYYVEHVATDLRHSRFFINSWSDTALEALSLTRQVEDALIASGLFVAEVDSEPSLTTETELEPWRYGCLQNFSIYSNRP